MIRDSNGGPNPVRAPMEAKSPQHAPREKQNVRNVVQFASKNSKRNLTSLAFLLIYDSNINEKSK